eukprot:RCo029442
MCLLESEISFGECQDFLGSSEAPPDRMILSRTLSSASELFSVSSVLNGCWADEMDRHDVLREERLKARSAGADAARETKGRESEEIGKMAVARWKVSLETVVASEELGSEKVEPEKVYFVHNPYAALVGESVSTTVSSDPVSEFAPDGSALPSGQHWRQREAFTAHHSSEVQYGLPGYLSPSPQQVQGALPAALMEEGFSELWYHLGYSSSSGSSYAEDSSTAGFGWSCSRMASRPSGHVSRRANRSSVTPPSPGDFQWAGDVAAEAALVEIFARLLQESALNPHHGSVSLEKLRFFAREEAPEIFHAVVGPAEAQFPWKAFIRKHRNKLRKVPGTTRRMKVYLTGNYDWKENDERLKAGASSSGGLAVTPSAAL